jgi:UDP-N-acetylglucosamine diphosphorylase / glucose-1-phosphate thymidylyltransferase / UDP-N-acetylgalactosamine diphosphorylase / glucosamine-1-phosphate N-acetyltransferase / galactosamine-1-phosphate N-acetyltransferase
MKQAIILAAGEGHRLKPFTIGKPKAMLSIAGKPIIQYVIESLAANGILKIIIVVGYQKEQIYDYIGNGNQFGVEIKYITQTPQLGTAHAVYQAKGETESEFLVLSANRLITGETIARIANTTPPAILVKQVESPVRYGVIKMHNGKFAAIVEKPEQAESNSVSAGIYALNSESFAYLESELNMPDVINKMLLYQEPVKLVETDKTWLDVVYPWDILSLNSIVLKSIKASQNGVIEEGVYLKGNISIGKDTVIRSNSYITGPVVIGKGCDIGPNVCIFPSTSIGDNAVISNFSEIRNSVLGDDVHIASNSAIHDSVIDSGSSIGTHFSAISEETEVTVDKEHHVVKIGSMLGRSCRIGSSVTSQSGTIIGNHVQVKSSKLLNGMIPDRSLVV